MVGVVEVAPAGSNSGYSELAGVLKFKVSRHSGSQPGVLTLSCGTDPVLDAAGTKRFYPFLNLRVVEGSPGTGGRTGRKYFDVRIDQAQIVEDEQYGRVWQISARDWISVLADNYIDKGEWFSASVAGRMSSHSASDAWLANYVGDYSDSNPDHPGEYRRFIIMDLALNRIHSSDVGLASVDIANAPNSKRIEWNADNNAQINILDAIRNLSASDPYSGSGGAEVDGKDLSDASFPQGSGFGGELQIVCNQTGDPPNSAEYYARGVPVLTGQFVYGDPHRANASHIIVQTNFNKQGADIYSRTRVVGKGEGQYQVNLSGNDSVASGQGISIPSMESTWNPASGLFHVFRENPNPRSQALVGESGYEDQADEKQAIRARALRDASYASLVSGGGDDSALSHFRGGENQGQITIAGGPINGLVGDNHGVIRPGSQIIMVIPHLGIDGSARLSDVFIVEDWAYDFPVDQTVLTVARIGSTEAGTQLLNQLRTGQDNATAHNDYYDSQWQKSDPSGTLVVKHSLGVKPSKITIEAATWDGSTLDQNKAPLPTFQTTVTVPATGWDAAQGQNHGYFVSRSDAETVSIKFAHWLAYSDGAGQWLKHDDPNTLVRVRVAP